MVISPPQIWVGVDYIASTASILNLFTLSLDRYWSVKQPLQYLLKRTKRRALSMIAMVWALSSLWLLPVSSWHHWVHGGVRTVPEGECDTEYAKNSLFKVVTAFFNFYLPLAVMYILYLRIFLAIKKRSKFEFGRMTPGKAAALSFKSSVVNGNTSYSFDESECLECSPHVRDKFGTTAGGNSLAKHRTSVFNPSHEGYNTTGLSSSRQHNDHRGQNGGARIVPDERSNLRMVTVKMQPVDQGGKGRSNSKGSLKVEYIYDESVRNPHTEKLERYFYEDHCRDQREFTSAQDGSAHIQRTSHPPADLPYSQTGNPDCCTKPTDQLKHTKRQNHSDRGGGGAAYKRGLFRQRRNKPSTFSSSSLSPDMGQEPPGWKYNHIDTSTPASSAFADIMSVRDPSSSSDDTSGDQTRPNGVMAPRLRPPADTDSTQLDLRHYWRCKQCSRRYDQKNDCGSGGSSSANGSCAKLDDVSASAGASSVDRRNSADRRRRLTTGVTSLRQRLKTIRQASSLHKEIKAARQLGVIMGAFTLCFLPYFILFMVVSLCDNCVEAGHLTAATWVGYLNSTLNPFLYPLCNANFRTKFRSMLGCRAARREGGAPRTTAMEYSERHTMANSRYD